MQPKQLPGFVYSQQKYDPNAYFDILEKSQRSRREQEQLVKKLKAEAARAPQSKKGTGRLGSNPLSAFISEGAGAGGALGGAAAGAALGSVVPGIGTIVGGVIGGGLGGFFGGAGGKAAENQLRDNEMRLGDVLGEGAISGAFGALGPAWQSVRGLSTLGKATGAGFGKATAAGANALSNVTDDAARAALGQSLQRGGKKAAQAAIRGSSDPNALQQAGRGVASNAAGVGIGAKAPGLDNLGPQASDEIMKALKQVGLGRNNPEKTLRGLEPILKTNGANIGSAYTNSVRKYTSQELNTVADDIIRTIVDDPSIELSKVAEDQLLRKVGMLTQKNTPLSMWDYQKQLGNAINFGKNAEAKLVDREAVARIIREKTSSLLDDAVPEIAGDRGLYHTLSDADKLMRVASKQADKSGLTARVLTSSPVRSAESKIGGGIEAAGNFAANPIVSNTARVGRGMATRGIAGALGGAGAMQPEQDDSEQLMQLYEQFSSGGGEYGGGETEDIFAEALINPGGAGGGGQPYGLQQALGEAQQLLGPNESPASYLAYAKELMTQNEPAESKGLNVTKPTSEKYAQAVSGAQALGQLEQLMSSDPNVLKNTRVPGRGISAFGIGSNIKNMTGTAEFDTLGFNAVDNMLRIATGAAAPESEIRRYMNSYLPQAGDSPAAAKQKLDAMRRQFNSILSLAQQKQTPSSLGDVLQQGAY